MRNLPTISKSALITSPCIHWCNPDSQWFDESKVDPEDKVAANLGISFHQHIDGYIKTGSYYCINEQLGWWLQHAAGYLVSTLKPKLSSLESEQAVAIQWLSGHTEHLPGVTDRKYPEYPMYPSNDAGYQFGTADLVGKYSDGGIYVGDWKTGQSEHPEADAQLMSLLYGFWTLDGQKDVRLIKSVLHVNDEGVWPNEKEVTKEELLVHADCMRMQWEDVLNGNTRGPVTGGHCTQLYCPHLAYCSAMSDAVRFAAEEDLAVPTESYSYTSEPVSDEQAGQTMALISAARRNMKYTESKLKDYVADGGRVVDGQWEWSQAANGFRWRKCK